MKHLTEDQLVLHYYGEAADREEAIAHLGLCEVCRKEFESLRETLDAVGGPGVPERGPDYGDNVWRRLEPLLPERPRGRRHWLNRLSWTWWNRRQLPSWAPAVAVACMVVLAFLAGHWVSSQRQLPERAALTEPQTGRILVIAVGDHLERSQLVLAELANAEPDEGSLDISEQREWAQELVGANRLYRQTAAREGEAGVATVLDDLERVLLEIAHSPNQISSDELEALRQRIDSQGILFKVRVVGSRLREKRPGGTDAMRASPGEAVL